MSSHFNVLCYFLSPGWHCHFTQIKRWLKKKKIEKKKVHLLHLIAWHKTGVALICTSIARHWDAEQSFYLVMCVKRWYGLPLRAREKICGLCVCVFAFAHSACVFCPQCAHGTSTCVSLFPVYFHVPSVCWPSAPPDWTHSADPHTHTHTHTHTQECKYTHILAHRAGCSDVTELTPVDWNRYLCKHVTKSAYSFKNGGVIQRHKHTHAYIKKNPKTHMHIHWPDHPPHKHTVHIYKQSCF